MKTLIIYDTKYGYTEQMAKAIGGVLEGEVKVVRVGEAKPEELGAYDLVIFGSPTQGGRETLAMKVFTENLPKEIMVDKKTAVFDTRMKSLWVKMFGWAANRMAMTMRERGANLVIPAEGFFVKSGKGPLVDGELERAVAWAKSLAAKLT